MRPARSRPQPSSNAVAVPPQDAPISQQSPQRSPQAPSPEDDLHATPDGTLDGTRAFFVVFRSKWSVLVLDALASPDEGGVRRHILARRVPDVSDKVLTDTLRHLEKAGLVRREVFASVPPRVDYSLTEAGSKMMEPLRSLDAWCRANRLDLKQALLLLAAKSP